MSSPRHLFPNLATVLAALALLAPSAAATTGTGGATAPGAGTTGATGSTGSTVASGSTGTSAPKGASGSTGSTGSKRSSGASGSQRPSGATGSKGSTGVTGVTNTAKDVTSSHAAPKTSSKPARKRTTSTTPTRRLAPVIFSVTCRKIGRTVCARNPHSVEATGELVVHAAFVTVGNSVYFPKAKPAAAATGATGASGTTGTTGAKGTTGKTGSTASTGTTERTEAPRAQGTSGAKRATRPKAGSAQPPFVRAQLRPTSHGLVVTVPSSAKSGRIYITGSGNLRSKLYGPITILAAPKQSAAPKPKAVTTPGPTTASGPPVASPFSGAGMWIWYLRDSDGGDLQKIAAQAHAAGITTLYVKSSDGGTSFWAQFTPQLVQEVHALGLDICAWQYVYGNDPEGEAALGVRAVRDGADCLVIDAEEEYDGKYTAAQTYVDELRAGVGAGFPIGLASFPYIDLHESVPYSVFLGPGGAQYDVPQVYWGAIGTTPDTAYSHMFVENRIYERPIAPLGQLYGGVSAASIERFRQLASVYGAPGVSWWDWQSAPTSAWSALTAPITDAAPIVVPQAQWPTLSKGSSGDQVIWMQEYLAAAEPQAPTDGVFGSTTESALKAFQASRRLEQTGATDAATWQALLALVPVRVTWGAPPPPTGTSGSTGVTGVTGVTGSSGATGASGASGASGVTGASGASGVSGVSGATGTSGPTSATGGTTAL